MANKRVNKLVAKKNRQPEVNGVPIDWDDTLLKNYPKVKDMRGQVFGELVVRDWGRSWPWLVALYVKPPR